MLRILIEEQEADNQREELLKGATKEQKAKMMKDINLERSKANAKIQKLEE